MSKDEEVPGASPVDVQNVQQMEEVSQELQELQVSVSESQSDQNTAFLCSQLAHKLGLPADWHVTTVCDSQQELNAILNERVNISERPPATAIVDNIFARTDASTTPMVAVSSNVISPSTDNDTTIQNTPLCKGRKRPLSDSSFSDSDTSIAKPKSKIPNKRVTFFFQKTKNSNASASTPSTNNRNGEPDHETYRVIEEASTFWLEAMNSLRSQRRNLIRAQSIEDQVQAGATPLTSYGLTIGQQHYQQPLHPELVMMVHTQARDLSIKEASLLREKAASNARQASYFLKTVADIYKDQKNADFNKAESKAIGIATLGGRREREAQNKITQDFDAIRPRSDGEWARALSRRRFAAPPQERSARRSRSRSRSRSGGRGRASRGATRGNRRPGPSRPQYGRSRSPPRRSPRRFNRQGRGREQARMGTDRPPVARASTSQRFTAPNNQAGASTSTAPRQQRREGDFEIDLPSLNPRERALIMALRKPEL